MDVQLKKEFEWEQVKDKEAKKKVWKNVDVLLQKSNESSGI